MTLKIGVLQTAHPINIEAFISQAGEKNLDLILLPELHNTPYFCQTQNPDFFHLAETIPGPTTKKLSALAKKNKLIIIGSIFEKRLNGLYHNTAVVFDKDGSLAGIYRKKHIPHDPGYCEKYYFAPGEQPFEPIQTSIGKLGVLVCWDQWFPEAARIMALKGADLLLYPTAIGYEPSDTQSEKDRQCKAWRTIQQSHAIANGIPVVSSNRIGFEKNPENPDEGIDFWGHSFIAGPFGEVLAEFDDTQSGLLISEIDLNNNIKTKHTWPFLRDRRVDSYGELLKLAD